MDNASKVSIKGETLDGKKVEIIDGVVYVDGEEVRTAPTVRMVLSGGERES